MLAQTISELSTLHTFVFHVRAISKDNEKLMGRGNGRFFLSAKFKAFEANLRSILIRQLPVTFLRYEGDVSVGFTFTFTNKAHCDLFNLTKGICDAFQDRRVKGMAKAIPGLLYKNDKQIKACHGMRIVYGEEDSFTMEIRPL